MKVLFLDVDGVLNSEDYYVTTPPEKRLSFPLGEFDPAAVKRVNRILDETQAKLVVSSSWRWNPGLKNIFEKVGINHEIWGRTPSGKGRNRGYEIQQFLNSHPEVSNYVILDDDSDMLEEQKNNFVHTNTYYGLTDEDTDKAIKILENE